MLEIISYHYKNFTDCVKKTYLTEGGRGFFRGRDSLPMLTLSILIIAGCIAPLASVTVVRMMSFGFYERTAQTCSSFYGRVTGHESPVENARVRGAMPTLASTACFAAAGAATGGLITFISCKSAKVWMPETLPDYFQVRSSLPSCTPKSMSSFWKRRGSAS